MEDDLWMTTVPADPPPEWTVLSLEEERRMSPGEKLLFVSRWNSEIKARHAAMIRARIPDATDEFIVKKWMIATLGPELAKEVNEAMFRRRHGGA